MTGPDDVGEGGHESVHGPTIVLAWRVMASQPLHGIKVVDAATLLAGPLIATLLGSGGRR